MTSSAINDAEVQQSSADERAAILLETLSTGMDLQRTVDIAQQHLDQHWQDLAPDIRTELFDAVREARECLRIDDTSDGKLVSIGLAEFMADPDPIEYVVEDLLARGWLYAICGATGAGKTALGVVLTACCCAGRPFAGKPTETVPVLYISAENPSDVRNRFIAATERMQISADAISRVQVIRRSFILAAHAEELVEIIEQAGAQLVLVDTDQAVALDGGADERDNTQRLIHARSLRALTRASSRPCVVTLAHPTKNAVRETLAPRGGSAFLNEVDGCVNIWRDDDVVDVFSHPDKFRGTAFSAQFRRVMFESARLVDVKGRRISVPVYEHVSDDEADRQRVNAWRDGNRLVYEMAQAPDGSQADWARACGWVNDAGVPRKDRVNRLLRTMSDARPALVRQARPSGTWRLTEAGKKEAARS